MVISERFLPILLVLVMIVTGYCVQGLSGDYNPLNSKAYEGYNKNSGWDLYLTDGPLSASTADFTKGFAKALCVRVVVFMAHGAVLDHVVTDCDAPEHSMGLVTQDYALKYFDLALVRQEAAGHFVLVKKTRKDGECSRTLYTLQKCTGQCPSPKVEKTEVSPDKSCKDLNDITYPPMWLISSSGDVGKFSPVSAEWMTYNPWEPLGFVTREYTYKSPSPCCYTAKCFRLVVVTSYGRAVHGVKLTCGPVSGITSTDRSLRLADTLLVTMYSQDKFTVLMNSRNSYCIKKQISVEVSGGSTSRKPLDTNNRVTLQDNDCKRLYNGEIKDRTVNKNTVDKLKTLNLKDVFKQELLKPYTASGVLLDYGLDRDMGMMVQTYTNQDKTQNNIVTLVARGVPVLPVIVDAGTPKRVVVRKNAVYYGKDVAFNKLYAEHGYQVLKRLDAAHCRRKLYDVRADGSLQEVKDENIDKDAPTATVGGTRKETETTKPKGDILHDDDCKNLVEGNDLKPNEAMKFGDLTDEMGVPKSLPSFLN